MSAVTTAATSPNSVTFMDSLGTALTAHLPAAPAVVRLIQAYFDPFECYVDLSDKEVLKRYIGKRFHKEPYLTPAHALAASVYQRAPRLVGDPKIGKPRGSAFSMNPEITAHLMGLVKEGGNVLEIAAAGGENSMLLAYAGGNVRVTINEVDSYEVEWIKKLRDSQPSDVAARIEVLAGNCMEVLANRPDFLGKFDLILCRKFIHYLNDLAETPFYALIKRLLKKETGRFCLTSDSVYQTPSEREVFRTNPSAVTFKSIQISCLDADRNVLGCMAKSIQPLTSFVNEASQTSSVQVYDRESDTIDQAVLNSPDVPQSLRDRFHKALSAFIKQLKGQPDNWTVVLQRHMMRAYSMETLTNLLNSHQFATETLFALNIYGHLNHAEDPFYGLTIGIGAIVRLDPNAPAPVAATTAAAAPTQPKGRRKKK
jgi:2-polyprenyl-3-methyl-5-hydroxy-6-metoxy-1,4-benzoquinol methylase